MKNVLWKPPVVMPFANRVLIDMIPRLARIVVQTMFNITVLNKAIKVFQLIIQLAIILKHNNKKKYKKKRTNNKKKYKKNEIILIRTNIKTKNELINILYVTVTQYIMEIEINQIYIPNSHNFKTACKFGNLPKVQWLLSVKLDLDVSEYQEFAFRSACRNGQLKVAQWLLSVKPEINISADDEGAFRFACGKGHLNVAQWLLSVKPEINISADDEDAFCFACQNGYLNVAQWLLSVKPSIHISAWNEEAFQIGRAHV